MKVTNLTISKRLKELGVNLPSDFTWEPNYEGVKYQSNSEDRDDVYMAYDLESLVKILPICLNEDPPRPIFICNKHDVGYIVRYERDIEIKLKAPTLRTHDSLVDCAGLTLIKLLEEGRITLDEVNNE